MKLIKLLLLVCMMLCLSTSAFAWNMLATSTYWYQDTSDIPGGSLFDQIDIVWLSGAQFNSPAMLSTGYGDSAFDSWIVSGTATQASAISSGGLSENYVDLMFNFIGASPAPTDFLYSVSLDNNVLMRQHVMYPSSASPTVNGWHWQYINAEGWNRLAPAPVPEPATLSLLGLGLLGLVGFKRKKVV